MDYLLRPKQVKGCDFGRSLYIVEDIKAGEKFTKENIRSIRHGNGMHPNYLKEIIETISVREWEKGELLIF